MKQLIFTLMMFSTMYAQSFYLSDCLLKSRKTVESIIKPHEVSPLSMNEQHDMYRYDDSIMVTYENDICTYIEVSSSLKFAALQAKYTFDHFVSSKDFIFTKVFIYDKYKNQYLLDVYNDGTTRIHTVYIQLMSATPKKPIK